MSENKGIMGESSNKITFIQCSFECDYIMFSQPPQSGKLGNSSLPQPKVDSNLVDDCDNENG